MNTHEIESLRLLLVDALDINKDATWAQIVVQVEWLKSDRDALQRATEILAMPL